ncbi:MAG: ABC transporter ATP-binding protein [Firmicutes bacterium]|jgi:ABC-type branched-subunit amino acid transport system ATPase component|nr:ABC transporter ATP-binding protein [Bacillota bacterium]
MSMLEVEGVSKRFGGIQALQGCSLSVEHGSVTGLIGPNGSGKTTLFNVVTGYARPDAGTVRFEGTAIDNLPPDRILALGIGRTFQMVRIFPRLTVLENMHVPVRRQGLAGVLSGASTHEERARVLDLLRFVGLERLKNEPAGNLSFGQRRLLEIACVLMAGPRVILLDEPGGGVNPTMLRAIAGHIRELNGQGITFFVVEHNMGFVMELCHRVIVMHRGSVIAQGDPEAVRRDPAVLEAYLGE